MLSKLENRVMKVIYCQSEGKDGLLISPNDIARQAGISGLKLQDIERAENDLYSDGYFDLVYSDRKGERIYCISLTEKGTGFKRSKRIFKRTGLFRIGLSVSLAVLSFLIGLLLKAIF